MGNFWDEESISEYEMLGNQESIESVPVYKLDEINEEDLEDIQEEAAFDLNLEESSVIYNARLRLEQARLYEMLINHNIFEGVEANPQAIKNVQGELKAYIVDRLEILLGIKKEKIETEEKIEIVSDLNDIELDFLKQLAYKGTKGASREGRVVVKEAKKSTGLKNLPSTKSSSLKSLGTSVKPSKEVVAPKETLQEPKLESKPRAKPKAKPKKGETKYERIAREQLEKEQAIMEGVDNWKKLSAEEKAKRIAGASGNKTVKRPNNVPPIPTADQLAVKYQTEQQSRSMRSDGQIGLIASAIAARKQQEE